MGAILSAKEAAAAVGMTKAGLIKAIHRGQLSASKDIHGNWRIDSSELFRVFEARPAQLSSTPVSEDTPVDADRARLEAENAILREWNAELRQQLESANSRADRLTALITTTQPPAPRPSWWRRLWGK